jgi:hypothetical protein
MAADSALSKELASLKEELAALRGILVPAVQSLIGGLRRKKDPD